MRLYRLTIGIFASMLMTGGFLAVRAQSNSAIRGRVEDDNGAVIAHADVIVRYKATGMELVSESDDQGNYQVVALPAGLYRIEVRAPEFQTQVVENITVEVGRSVVQDFRLRVGDLSQEVTVTAAPQTVERTTISVGHVIGRLMVQQIPLNGRHFLDLGLLVPGSVTPPQGAFSASPMRGLGAFSFNTAGNREETINYVINGITLNNLTFSTISFQPSINTIQEFEVKNSTESSEFGESSGAVVNIATRSGDREFHADLFDFFRNAALDARNFFEFTSSRPEPFQRNQFGGSLGGPVVQNKAFFFFSYEGLGQRQQLNLNSLVLSDAQRASVTDPVIRQLIKFIPSANFADSSGSRYIGTATAPVDGDQWTVDISQNLGIRDRLHGYYNIYKTEVWDPGNSGTTIAGFGNLSLAVRQILTLNEIHTFGPALINEARFGFNRLSGKTLPNAQVDPEQLGIHDGIRWPIGLPQISVGGGSLNFGGPSGNPSGRGDTTFTASDTLSWLCGNHSIKLGGEFRQFLNNNFKQGTGSFNFQTVADFLAGTANAFSITLGNQTSSIEEGALGLYVQDNYRWRPNLTFELGLRYDWNMTPNERYNRLIVFDPASVSLIQAGSRFNDVYHQNNKNVQPRLGFAWDPWSNGKTAVRAAYAIQTDQPMTSVVTPLAANPPLAEPLTFTGPIRLDNAIDLARAAGLAPQTVDPGFDNAYLQSWNLNLQRLVTSDFVVMAGYFGSKGTHLILRRNINQPVNGVRPYPALSPASPILPGAPLGNITQTEGSGNSSYNALWVTANQRLACGLQFDLSYTWSKSLDYNSFSTGGVVAQNSYDLSADRGLSDFDARHRVVVSALYELPFHGNRLIQDWQLAAIVQAQSGNPVNIVTGNSMVNGVANTLRPDVIAPVTLIGSVDQWFDTTAFKPAAGFGNLGRNVVIGPGFNNTDFSITKSTALAERIRLQFRTEFFDVFNHANFGRPGNVVGTPNFGRITSTRFPTGESGSSRQVQFVLKLSFQ